MTSASGEAHFSSEARGVPKGPGRFVTVDDGESRTMRPGDVAVIPPWVPHGARTLDSSCQEVDVFAPPRKTLVEHARASAGQGG